MNEYMSEPWAFIEGGEKGVNPTLFARAAARTHAVTKQMTDKDLRDAVRDYAHEADALYRHSILPDHLDRLLSIIPIYALCVTEQQKRIEQET